MNWLLSADTQRISNAVDVVEPGRDQRDLEYGSVIESLVSQPFVVLRADLRCIFCELYNVIQHRALSICDGSACVVLFERSDQRLVQCHPTQKLCVRFDSIVAPVCDRHHGRDHLMVASVEG